MKTNLHCTSRLVTLIGWVALSVCLLGFSGCEILGRFRQPADSPPVILDDNLSLNQLLTTLNNQSKKVQTLRTDVRVSTAGAPTMRGKLSIERPRRLRMTAGVAGISVIDVGSNDELFWVWTKAATPGQPPTFMYANHIDFETSPIRQQIPLDPTWLIDGLGLVEFSPADRHEGPYVRPIDGRIEVRTFRRTATGQNIRVCVIDPKTAQILQQTFYDGNGNRIAYVNAIKHRYYEENDVSLPERLEIHVAGPDNQSTKLTLDAGKYTFNAFYGDSNILWDLPDSPDVNRVNLAEVQEVVRPEGESAKTSALDFPRRRPESNTFESSIHR